MLSEKMLNVSGSQTMAIAAKAIELKSQGADVVDLSVGEPDFPTPLNVKEAAIKAIHDNKTKYTLNKGITELREAVAGKFKSVKGLTYSPDNILVSCGAKHSIFNAILALLNEGDEVIIPAPYWVSYPEMVKIAGGNPVVIDTGIEDGFKINASQIEKAVTLKTKAIILCSPSNPTGSAYTEEELKAIAEVLEGRNVYVIADEIYDELVYDGFKNFSIASLSNDLFKRTLTISGVSKTYSMTGWRIGFTAGPANVIKEMSKLQSHSSSAPSSISQYAALEAVTGPQDFLQEMLTEYTKRRDYFHTELNKIEGINCRKPEGAFYMFPEMSGFIKNSGHSNSHDTSMYLIEKANVATVPGSAFGAEGYIRMSFAASMERLEEAVRRLNKLASGF